MNGLLQVAVNAHGRLERWNQLKTVKASVYITGALLRVAHHRHRCVRVCDRRRPTGAVDHVEDASRARRREEDGQQIMKACRWERGWSLKRVRSVDVHALIEEAVTAHAIPRKAADRVGNFERCPAVYAWRLHPSCLAGRVVGHLVLEEDVCAVVAVPYHLVLLVVLDK